MKFKIDKGVFSTTLNKVVGVISSKSVMPVLNGIYISVSDEGVTLIGSDGDIYIQAEIQATQGKDTVIESIEAGSVIVPAKLLNSIIRKLPENTVTLDVNDKLGVKVISGKSNFKLNGQSGDEYPKLPKVKDKALFHAPSNILRSVIRETVFATADSDSRPILTGVNLEKCDDENRLKFVATDSHRLSQCLVDVSELAELENVTIPGKSLLEVNKVLPDTDELVSVSTNGNTVVFETEGVVLYSRVLDGNFPDTKRLLPEESKTKLNVSKKEMIDSLERATLLSDGKNSVVKLNINGGLMAEITSNSPEVGNLAESVVVSNLEGEEITISFSAKYVIDALKAINAAEVIFDFNGKMRPFTITAENEPTLQLVLPVRTM